jgi:uncharacterized membrane protein YfcA
VVYVEFFLLAGAALIAGIMNAVAGGGTFITFPMLVFLGVPPINANASNAVGLFPGTCASAWAYRHDYKNFDGVPFWALATMGVGGGLTGAVLLLLTPGPTFDAMVPWLILVATLIFIFGPRIAPRLHAFFSIGPKTLLAVQFTLSIYGGYFGGAMGIIMLAVYSLFGQTNLNTMNATKTLMAGFINGIAVIIFVTAGIVWWSQTFALLIGSSIGGYVGARVARRMNQKYVRIAIIVISIGVTIAFFVRG